MQTVLTSPTLWLILIPFVFVFLLLVYVATYNLLKRAVKEVTEDAIYDTVYDAIDDALKNSVSADGVHSPQFNVDVDDLADKIDKTFKLSKATYRNVKSLTED